MTFKNLSILTILLLFLLPAIIIDTGLTTSESTDNDRYLVIRADDFGMTHSANMALKKLIETGMPLSASVMPPTPWFLEAAEVLNEHPEVSVGVHLTLNSEWKNYRWGPVLGQEAVPSLVDENGYFFPSSADLYNNNPDMIELERELKAQIRRALDAGLNVDYLDSHMGTAMGNPEFREVTERVASEFDLVISGNMDENFLSGLYWAPPESKLDSLRVMIPRAEPGINTVIVHVGLDTPEMAALVDMNVDNPLPDMYKHRYGELQAFTSDEFKNLVDESGVKLINYRDVIRRLEE